MQELDDILKFAEYFKNNWEYYDNTEEGDIYLNKFASHTGSTFTRTLKQIHAAWYETKYPTQ